MILEDHCSRAQSALLVQLDDIVSRAFPSDPAELATIVFPAPPLLHPLINSAQRVTIVWMDALLQRPAPRVQFVKRTEVRGSQIV